MTCGCVGAAPLPDTEELSSHHSSVSNTEYLTDLTAPASWYPAARMVRRKIVAHMGPTNSGKTHAALQALKAAGTGVYCGPLRLLAWEASLRRALHVSMSPVGSLSLRSSFPSTALSGAHHGSLRLLAWPASFASRYLPVSSLPDLQLELLSPSRRLCAIHCRCMDDPKPRKLRNQYCSPASKAQLICQPISEQGLCLHAD